MWCKRMRVSSTHSWRNWEERGPFNTALHRHFSISWKHVHMVTNSLLRRASHLISFAQDKWQIDHIQWNLPLTWIQSLSPSLLTVFMKLIWNSTVFKGSKTFSWLCGLQKKPIVSSDILRVIMLSHSAAVSFRRMTFQFTLTSICLPLSGLKNVAWHG